VCCTLCRDFRGLISVQFARDELQVDMIAESSRKRRRLERERRAIERPQPGMYFELRNNLVYQIDRRLIFYYSPTYTRATL